MNSILMSADILPLVSTEDAVWETTNVKSVMTGNMFTNGLSGSEVTSKDDRCWTWRRIPTCIDDASKILYRIQAYRI